MKHKSALIHSLFLVPCLVSLLLVSSLPADEVTFDLDALAKFGTRRYKMVWTDRSSGKPVEHDRGTMTLSAAVAKDGVTLKSLTRIYMPDGKRFIEFIATCQCTPDKSLSLHRIDMKVSRSDGVVLHEGEATVEKGELHHRYVAGGKTKEERAKWIDGTMVDVVVFFLVPQLAREKGTTVTIDHVIPCPTTAIPRTQSRTITCIGLATEEFAKGKKLAKFVNKAKGEKNGIICWVDEEGVLQRVLLTPENRLDLEAGDGEKEGQGDGER